MQKSNETKYKIGDRIVAESANRKTAIDYIITGVEQRVIGNSKRKWRFYEYKCNLCGAEHLWKIGSDIGRKGCACCVGHVKIRGINTIGDLYPDCLPYFVDEDAFDPNLRITDRYDALCPICGTTNEVIIDNLVRGHFYCNHCNSFGAKRPELVKYLVNQEDAKLSFASNKKVLVKCPDCGDERHMMLKKLNEHGYNCRRCGDDISFPEKFVINVLMQLNVDFITQLSSSNCEWCGKYKYDFYIPCQSIIIETHGRQHYEDSFSRLGGRTMKEEQENDTIKEHLAKNNNIASYIVLDCRESSSEWIQRSILNSELNAIFDLSKIDWVKCLEFVSSSWVKKVCKYWHLHNELTTSELGEIFHLGRSAVRKYLKIGTSLGWCNYDVEAERQKNRARIVRAAKHGKPIMALRDEQCVGIFDSVAAMLRELKETYGVRIYHRQVNDVCVGKVKHCHGFTFQYI